MKSATIFWRARLVGVPDDTWIEQGRRLERVLVKKISTYQAALRLVQFSMGRQRLLHICSARLKDIEQIPVTTFEIIQHVCELPRGGFGIESKNPVDNMVGPELVGWVEVSGFSRRPKGPDDHSGWIRTKM